MTLEERKRTISIFAKLGVTKLRFTGGEPTISDQLIDLIRFARQSNNIKSIGITTNGLVLSKKLDALVDAGMTSVNISLDTLIKEKYASITRRSEKNLYRVLSAVYAAVAKNIPVKINIVLIRGVNDEEVSDFVEMTRDVPVDCRFIELVRTCVI
jgi:molybdenum cofactor biosynthesis enzyme MoaA